MTKVANILKKLAEFAPGIPDKAAREVPRISSPQIWRMAVQAHKAAKAGQHYDLRIIDDKTGKAYSWALRHLPTNPGDKVLAKLQPTHTADYATWSGEIESGYGAGTVELFKHDKIELTKAEPGKISFNVYKSNGDTERYVMINTGEDNWLFHNVTATRKTRPEVPAEKPHYKTIKPEDLDPNNPNEVWSPKVDGALNVFVLRRDKPIETYSYRPSRKGEDKLIDHTFRVPLHQVRTPKGISGKNVLLGEVFARDRITGKPLPNTDTSARLLSNVWRSRELQEKAPLDNMVFNVLRYQGRDVSKLPYAEKLEIIKRITASVPQLNMAPMESSPQGKAALLKAIKDKRHSLSEEGVVVYNLKEDTPRKAKLREDYDVYIRGIYPGKGKHKGVAAGGFEYSYEPQGKRIGRVGAGFSDVMRRKMWENPEKFRGALTSIYAQQKLPSGALRVPIFKGIRAEKFPK